MTDWTGMSARPRTPPPGLKSRVLARAGAAGARRPWPLALAAGLVLIAGGLGWWGWSEAQNLAAARGQFSAAMMAYHDTLSLLRSPGTRVIQIPVSTNGQVGAVTIFADTMTHRWLVTCHHLATNQPGQVYQLWFITSTGMVSAAVIPMSGNVPMVKALEMPKGAGSVMGAAMSIEPGRGSPAPTGPIVFHYLL
ncbi:MAG TPA: anti-sigma factor [Gemmatimonadales bacterium]|jgi:anti-sigma-K factor RskA|nr:anti-sigma factor [Gemmatimonadales bacterium]